MTDKDFLKTGGGRYISQSMCLEQVEKYTQM